jgi:hypothetical protein
MGRSGRGRGGGSGGGVAGLRSCHCPQAAQVKQTPAALTWQHTQDSCHCTLAALSLVLLGRSECFRAGVCTCATPPAATTPTPVGPPPRHLAASPQPSFFPNSAETFPTLEGHSPLGLQLRLSRRSPPDSHPLPQPQSSLTSPTPPPTPCRPGRNFRPTR